MPKFDKNLQIKNDIRHTARRLFYDKGYDQTIFADIAAELNITKGHISYYFDTKANLANIIFNESLSENQNRLSIKMYERFRDKYSYNPRIITTLSNIASYDMYSHDDKASRFVVEFLTHNMQFSIENDNFKLWQAHGRAVDKERLADPAYLKMLGMASRGASSIVQLAYYNGKLDISSEQFTDFILRIKYQIEGLPNDEIDKIITTAWKIYSQLDVRTKPYFIVE